MQEKVSRLEYLESLYTNEKSIYLDKIQEFYLNGNYKDDFHNEATIKDDKLFKKQISKKEYNFLKQEYLEQVHSFKKINPNEIYNDKRHLSEILQDIKRKIRDFRRKEYEVNLKKDLNKKSNRQGSSFISYEYGFLTYKKNNPLGPFYPLFFGLASIIIGISIVLLIVNLLSYIFD